MRTFVFSIMLLFLSGLTIGQNKTPPISGDIMDCIVTGPSSIAVGQTATFSIPSNLGNCTDCYFWEVTGGVTIVGSNTKHSIQVKGITEGSFSVRVTYFKDGKCYTCARAGICQGIDPAACCPPDFSGFFICRSGNGGGHISIKAPVGGTCNFDVSTIAKIEVTINGGQFTDGSISKTFNNPVSLPISQAIVVPDCYSYAGIPYTLDVDMKVTYNNGCPSYTKVLILEDGGGVASRPITIFPNPADNFINFNAEEDISNYTISLYDIAGVEMVKNASMKESYDTSSWKAGYYFYVIYEGSEVIQRGKIIIK